MLASWTTLISVIIPIRDEAPHVAEGFRALSRDGETEVLVADGGGRPETTRAFAAMGARIVCGSGSRGLRLDRAAREARGEILFFLHADSRPPDDALDHIRETLDSGASA